jgi:hypothetical protein
MIKSFAFCALTVVAVACTKDPTPEEACQSFSEAFTELVSRCFPSGATGSPRVMRRYNEACQRQIALDGSRTGPREMLACAEAMKTADCAGGMPDACATLPGARSDGAPCESDTQCASTSCGGHGAQCGVCVPSIPEGGDCSTANTRCVSGTTCFDGRCSRRPSPRGVNETCTNLRDCGAGLTCVAARCAPLRAEGQACEHGLACAAGLYCNAARTCARYASEGEACAGQDVRCGSGLLCREGACRRDRHVQPGETCDQVSDCDVGACHEGRCPRVIGDGQPCDAKDRSTVCDALATCLDGVCVGPATRCK